MFLVGYELIFRLGSVACMDWGMLSMLSQSHSWFRSVIRAKQIQFFRGIYSYANIITHHENVSNLCASSTFSIFFSSSPCFGIFLPDFSAILHRLPSSCTRWCRLPCHVTCGDVTRSCACALQDDNPKSTKFDIFVWISPSKTGYISSCWILYFK